MAVAATAAASAAAALELLHRARLPRLSRELALAVHDVQRRVRADDARVAAAPKATQRRVRAFVRSQGGEESTEELIREMVAEERKAKANGADAGAPRATRSGANTPSAPATNAAPPQRRRKPRTRKRANRTQSDPFGVAMGDAVAFLNAAEGHQRAQRLLVGGIEIAAHRALALDCLQAKRLAGSEWHSPNRRAELEQVAAASWYLATDVCSRKALTCLPGGPTAMDNDTFATVVNCSLGGIAPMLRGKVGKPIVVPKRTGENIGDARRDGALGQPLDALGTNLLAADVGGGRGGFELRHDGFRDILLRELRSTGFSVEKEFEIGVEHGLADAHAAVLRGSLAMATQDALAHIPEAELSDMERQAKAGAQREVQEALRHGATEAELRAHGGSAKGMRIDLGVMRAEGALERQVFEVKSMAFCKSRYGTREHKNGCSWADRRGALAIKERTDQARKLDAGLFRGTALAPMETALGGLGVQALVVGGCCELNTTAHHLIAEIGTQLGIRAATASGEDVNQCVALETTRVRQRIGKQIWSDYQDYICARIKFADPTPDKQRANEDEAVEDATTQALHAQRYAIQAYLHRTRQPLELGV